MRWDFGCASRRAPICRFSWSPKTHTVLLFTNPWYSLHSDLRIVFSVWVARHRLRTDLPHESASHAESPLSGGRNGLVIGRKCSIAASVVVKSSVMNKRTFPLIGIAALALGASVFSNHSYSRAAPLPTPLAPKITSVESVKKNSKTYDLRISVSVNKGTSKLPIVSTLVTATNKSCNIASGKQSCTITGLPMRTQVTIRAISRNKNGTGTSSSPVRYTVGSARWSIAPQLLRLRQLFQRQGLTASSFLFLFKRYEPSAGCTFAWLRRHRSATRELYEIWVCCRKE